jgi:hypothetical protein
MFNESISRRSPRTGLGRVVEARSLSLDAAGEMKALTGTRRS